MYSRSGRSDLIAVPRGVPVEVSPLFLVREKLDKCFQKMFGDLGHLMFLGALWIQRRLVVEILLKARSDMIHCDKLSYLFYSVPIQAQPSILLEHVPPVRVTMPSPTAAEA